MESAVKKYQQSYRRVREKMDEWDELQTVFIQQFTSASCIIGRLDGIQDRRSYGVLNSIDGIGDLMFGKQVESLETIFQLMMKTLGEFRSAVKYMEKLYKSSGQLIMGSSNRPSTKQLQARVGVKPCLADCLDGLRILYEMHHSEYLLKSSIFSALPAATLKPSIGDLGAMQQLLVDQPNIPKDEVKLIFDIIFAEEVP